MGGRPGQKDKTAGKRKVGSNLIRGPKREKGKGAGKNADVKGGKACPGNSSPDGLRSRETREYSGKGGMRGSQKGGGRLKQNLEGVP